MVTLPLERMASRVAASLCYATGLGPEMVVNSQVSTPARQVADFLIVCATLNEFSPSDESL